MAAGEETNPPLQEIFSGTERFLTAARLVLGPINGTVTPLQSSRLQTIAEAMSSQDMNRGILLWHQLAQTMGIMVPDEAYLGIMDAPGDKAVPDKNQTIPTVAKTRAVNITAAQREADPALLADIRLERKRDALIKIYTVEQEGLINAADEPALDRAIESVVSAYLAQQDQSQDIETPIDWWLQFLNGRTNRQIAAPTGTISDTIKAARTRVYKRLQAFNPPLELLSGLKSDI